MLLACLPVQIADVHAKSANVHNYGENLTGLQQAFSNKNVHILQIGDSHTAGDYFTEQLRKRLQADIGDGGVGFAYPAKISGQRNARHGYASNWQTDSSKYNKWGGNYPIGGIIAHPKNKNDVLTLTSQYYAGDKQTATMMIYGNQGQPLTLSSELGKASIMLKESGWQTVSIPIIFPTSIQTEPSVKIGGFWLRKSNQQHGGIVSAMGINGSTQDYWKRWHSNLSDGLASSQADLVILAYGTNEAFRNKANNLTQDMNKAIKNIRAGLPNAAILIVGAPESLKHTNSHCGVRSPSLNSVQQQLQKVAQNNQTLYWDWQAVMGGSCSMQSWIDQGLAARDGVHFTRAGYNLAANDLYSNLKLLLKTNNNSTEQSAYHSVYNNNGIEPYETSQNAYTEQDGYVEEIQNTNPNDQLNKESLSNGEICNSDGLCIKF